jgi:EPS-associated MarR family transcriptional regulator
MNEENTYKLFKALETTPDHSQRQLAEELGFSLGKLNYCLKALIDKGLVKAENFRQAKNKRRYIYKLTPAGLKEKAAVTMRFLKQKQNEYEKIKLEINQLQKEVKKEAVKI